MSLKNKIGKFMGFGKEDFVKVEDKNRFYYMLQQMQANRWRITAIVLGLFFILLGAFVGNLNKVVDYWFNSEDRDKMLIQKVDEEDGTSLSNVTSVNPSETID